MNYNKALIPLALIVVATLSTSPAWAIRCEDLFSDGGKGVQLLKNDGFSHPMPNKSLVKSTLEEQQDLRHQLDSLGRGEISPNTIAATPANREVTMTVSSKTSTSFYEGRIVAVRPGTDGQPEVHFLRKNYVQTYATRVEVIPLSKIEVKSLGIRKVLTAEEQQMLVARLQVALQAGDHISYLNQFSNRHEVNGRIVSFERDETGKINSFVLAEDTGIESLYSLYSVDPTSIRFFKPSPRKLNPAETIFVAELNEAISAREYVSFRVNSGSRVHRYEGWVTESEVASNGDYLFRVNENKCEMNCGYRKYRLSDILVDSLERKPSLMVRESGQIQTGGRAAVRASGYIENRRSGNTQPVFLSQNFYSELSIFADSKQPSGTHVPYELEDLVSPGSELRLYFTSGDRSIRLTVRRDVKGRWSFGDTAFDRLTINESDLDTRSNSRYPLNERDRLEHSRFEGRLPAAALRHHMRMIRNSLMKGQVDQEFAAIQTEWAKSIPENIGDDEVIELLLQDQDLHFYLNRGFVRERQPSLTGIQTKILMAIKYLVHHKLIFYSYNAGASGIKEGIYPQGSVKPHSLWLTGYDFGQQLLQSMEDAGLQFVNGQWGPK